MGEMRTLNTVLDAIFDPDTINAAMRAGGAELQDWLGWFFFDTSDTGHGVHGFSASVASLNITVARGGGLVRNASAPSPASKWAWIYMGASQIVAAAARHATLDRIDTISVSWTQDADTVVNVGFEGDVPDDVATQRGCQATIVITTGTPDASPVAPATPSGHELLWTVLVPSTADGGALKLYDNRRFLPGPANRTRETPITFQGFTSDALMSIATFRARKVDESQATWASGLFFDVIRDWLFFFRAGPNAQSADPWYPLSTPTYDGNDHPSWSRTFGVLGYTAAYKAGSSSEITHTVVLGDADGAESPGTPIAPFVVGVPHVDLERIATASDTRLYLYFPISVDVRGVRATAFSVIAKTVTKFTGTSTGLMASLLRIEEDGTVGGYIAATKATMMPASTDTDPREYAALASSGSMMIGDNDRLVAFVRVDGFSGDGGAGKTELHGFRVQFAEGQSD